MFGFLKEKLSNVYHSVTQRLSSLFTKPVIDEEWLTELREILLSADTGRTVTTKIIDELRIKMQKRQLSGQEAQQELHILLSGMLPPVASHEMPPVLLMVGINGSGKTTFIGKLAAQLTRTGKKVLLVAGDTFRAAAADQLEVWANRSGVALHFGKENQDPASVIFDACSRYQNEMFDYLIIDTAGRLQTRVSLMNELAKMHRMIEKKLPNITAETWLSLDTMLGQNSIAQAKEFHATTKLSGLVLTKCDGTGKGGFILAISHELHLPIRYITFGEQIDALAPFDGEKFITELLAKE